MTNAVTEARIGVMSPEKALHPDEYELVNNIRPRKLVSLKGDQNGSGLILKIILNLLLINF